MGSSDNPGSKDEKFIVGIWIDLQGIRGRKSSLPKNNAISLAQNKGDRKQRSFPGDDR